MQSKQCTVENCKNPIFAKGLCKNHQHLRNDTVKGIRQVSEAGKYSNEAKKLLQLEDQLFYMKLWKKLPHICYETGKYLGNEPQLSFFHHVLPKELYPEFRHEEWNIVFLLPNIHNQVETNIILCPKVHLLTKQLKQKYVSRS